MSSLSNQQVMLITLAIGVTFSLFWIWKNRNEDKSQSLSHSNTSNSITKVPKKQKFHKVELRLDDQCSNLYEWFKKDTDRKIFLGFAGTIDKKSTLTEIANLPNTDIYQKRFSHNVKSPFYFRRGNMKRIDRFTALHKGQEIGHITCLYVESPHLASIGKNCHALTKKNIVGWVYEVYMAPHARGKGFGKSMVNASVQQFRDNGIFDVYLIVVDNNIAALKSYQACGFQNVKEFHLDGDIKIMMKHQPLSQQLSIK